MLCLDHLGYSYQNYEVFHSINKIVEKSLNEISIVPLNASRPFMNINTAIYNVGEMGSFNNGLLICNTIKNAKKILACPTDTIKMLYLYDLDWMFNPMLYEELYSILTDKNLKIVLRSKDFVAPIRCLVGEANQKLDLITPSFNLETIWNLL